VAASTWASASLQPRLAQAGLSARNAREACVWRMEIRAPQIPALASLRDAPVAGRTGGIIRLRRIQPPATALRTLRVRCSRARQVRYQPSNECRSAQAEGVAKVFASGRWGMAKNQETAILDFAVRVRVRGFSGIECPAFLCAFAPLREYIPFWESVSRKGAKAQSCPEGPSITESAFSSRNRFLTSYSVASKTFCNTFRRVGAGVAGANPVW